jgi:hypothetical protein
MTLALPAEGGCQCGAIRYRLTGEPEWLAVCHCTNCKRQSGGAFSMSLRMRAADVQLSSGEPKRWTLLSDDGSRAKICHFCATCGVRLWHEHPEAGAFHVKPGTLDDTSQLVPRYEGWTIRKLPWLTISGLKASFNTQP